MAESPRLDAALPPVPTGTHPWVAQWQDRVGFGVSIFPQPPDWQGFIRLVQRMEAMGIDSYWSYDHPAANADCWTALAALASLVSVGFVLARAGRVTGTASPRPRRSRRTRSIDSRSTWSGPR